MKAMIVVGGFWGDEGKGKIVAYLAQKERVAIVARGGVGPNAGHTVAAGGEKHGVRMIPSGYVCRDARLLIGAGVLVNPEILMNEVNMLGVGNRVGVDERCSVIEERHITYDKENTFMSSKIGTTGTGCGPANADRVLRIAKQARDIASLKPFLTDVPVEVNEALDKNRSVVLEGTQGFGISLYYGSYPYVTSKDTTASQIAADVGIGPTRVGDVIIVFKAFPTRVGAGPFETEMSEEEAKKLGIEEYGTVTGRKRRIGRWDGKFARYSAMLNGATQCAITGLDKLDPSCNGVKEYDKLSEKVKNFVKQAEKDVGVAFTLLSTGPDVLEIVDLRG